MCSILQEKELHAMKFKYVVCTREEKNISFFIPKHLNNVCTALPFLSPPSWNIIEYGLIHRSVPIFYNINIL